MAIVSDFAATEAGTEKGATAKAVTPCFLWCPETESNRRHEDFQFSPRSGGGASGLGLLGAGLSAVDVRKACSLAASVWR